jgi:hypothetical protein
MRASMCLTLTGDKVNVRAADIAREYQKSNAEWVWDTPLYQIIGAFVLPVGACTRAARQTAG